MLGKWFLFLTIISTNLIPTGYCRKENRDGLSNSSGNPNLKKIIHLNKSVIQAEGQPPIMLLWHPIFGDSTWAGLTEKALSNGCFLTSDRRLLKNAKVVIFHWFPNRNFTLPDMNKYQDQIWIWMTREPPPHHRKPYLLAEFQQHIDCWASYRMDSDFLFDYGRVIPRELDDYREDRQVSLTSKGKSVAWMVSHCDTCGGRDEYVKELSEYISVDIYGYCGSLNCSTYRGWKNEDCWKQIGADYKFYLSFENSICKDYLTEKVIYIMSYDIIPIVFGGADYQAILPNNSFIDALQFTSPRHLASFLNQLAGDEDRYNSYFEWKSHFKIIRRNFKDGFEDICTAFKGNEVGICKQRDENLVDWWYNGSQCKNWSPILGLRSLNLQLGALQPFGCEGRTPPKNNGLPEVFNISLAKFLQ